MRGVPNAAFAEMFPATVYYEGELPAAEFKEDFESAEKRSEKLNKRGYHTSVIPTIDLRPEHFDWRVEDEDG